MWKGRTSVNSWMRCVWLRSQYIRPASCAAKLKDNEKTRKERKKERKRERERDRKRERERKSEREREKERERERSTTIRYWTYPNELTIDHTFRVNQKWMSVKPLMLRCGSAGLSLLGLRLGMTRCAIGKQQLRHLHSNSALPKQ